MSQNQKQNVLPQNLDAKYAPKNSRHWNSMQNLVKYYAAKICISKFNEKPKPNFVGTELMSRLHIWKNALQMEEIN